MTLRAMVAYDREMKDHRVVLQLTIIIGRRFEGFPARGIHETLNNRILCRVHLCFAPLLAAVGCDLNDPDRDVKRLFPGSTGFKTLYVSIDKAGGQGALAAGRRAAG